MLLLHTIKPEDVDNNAPAGNYAAYTSRTAVRAIVFDGAKVALIFVRKHGYYMLPGGGVDESEDKMLALHRELKEELGCKTEVTGEIGSITIYNDRWRSKQTDYCYTATLVERGDATMPTNFERDEGHEVIWTSTIFDASQRMRGAMPLNRDGKLVRARDLRFLETAQQLYTTKEFQ